MSLGLEEKLMIVKKNMPQNSDLQHVEIPKPQRASLNLIQNLIAKIESLQQSFIGFWAHAREGPALCHDLVVFLME